MSAAFSPQIDPGRIPVSAAPKAHGGSRVPGVFDTDPAFSTFESAPGASDAFGTGLEAPELFPSGSGEPLSSAVEASQADGVSTSPAADGPVAAGEGMFLGMDVSDQTKPGSIQFAANVSVILQLICAHDGVGEGEALARAICAYGEKIGIASLAKPFDGDDRPRHAVLARGGEGDLVDLVDFPRAGMNRFRGGAPP